MQLGFILIFLTVAQGVIIVWTLETNILRLCIYIACLAVVLWVHMHLFYKPCMGLAMHLDVTTQDLELVCM